MTRNPLLIDSQRAVFRGMRRSLVYAGTCIGALCALCLWTKNKLNRHTASSL